MDYAKYGTLQNYFKSTRNYNLSINEVKIIMIALLESYHYFFLISNILFLKK